MDELPETNPEVHAEFKRRKFTICEKDGIFKGVWPDLALEQTYKKEGKSSQFKGISQNTATCDKYVKTMY